MRLRPMLRAGFCAKDACISGNVCVLCVEAGRPRAHWRRGLPAYGKARRVVVSVNNSRPRAHWRRGAFPRVRRRWRSCPAPAKGAGPSRAISKWRATLARWGVSGLRMRDLSTQLHCPPARFFHEKIWSFMKRSGPGWTNAAFEDRIERINNP